MRTFAFTKNGRVALFTNATEKQAVNIYRHVTLNNAHMADWAAEAAKYHHGTVVYKEGEYPACFSNFFTGFPTVTFSAINGGWVYTWEAKGVSILLQD